MRRIVCLSGLVLSLAAACGGGGATAAPRGEAGAESQGGGAVGGLGGAGAILGPVSGRAGLGGGAASGGAGLGGGMGGTPPLVTLRNGKSPRQVSLYVAGWGIDDALVSLGSSFGGVRPLDAATRLILQSFNLEADGTITNTLGPDATSADAATAKVLDLGRDAGLDVLLCLTNFDRKNGGHAKWSWLTSAIKADGGQALTERILAIMDRYGFAGVDLNLEGEDIEGPYNDVALAAYLPFYSRLADAVHARGGVFSSALMTVSSASPPPQWWSALASKSDAMLPMALERYAWDLPGSSSYAGLQRTALRNGVAASAFTPILPLFKDTWGGSSPLDNVLGLSRCVEQPSNVALYSVNNLSASTAWSDPAIWSTLKAMRDAPIPSHANCGDAGDASIVDLMKYPGVNLRGGQWLADSDFWSRLGLVATGTPPAGSLYPTEKDAWNASTRVWNSAKDYDLALQNGRWAEITKGYTSLANTNGPVLSAVFQVTSPVSPTATWAGGSLLMEFEERDCSKSPDACWELAKTGTARDLSAYGTLVLGLSCSQGKVINVLLNLKSQVEVGFGVAHKCSGGWEDVTLDLKANPALLPPGASLAWNAKDVLRLSIGVSNDGSPLEVAVTVAGVALDRSVVQLRGLTP